MKKILLVFALLGVSVSLFAFMPHALAVENVPCPEKTGPWDPGCLNIQSKDDVKLLAISIAKFIRTIFWILVVIMIFFTAYTYLSAGTNEKNIEKATKMLRYTIYAIIVALLATSLPFLLKNILGGFVVI